jgi:hypothetical protein
MSDPRYTDPRLSAPVLRRDEAVNGKWGWIAGIAVVALIAFLVIAGISGHNNTASNGPPPVTTGSTSRPLSSPATTGSGAMSPRPLTPAMPAPNKGGTQ